MPRYSVHMFIPVRFKVEGVEAESQVEAIKKVTLHDERLFVLISSIFNNDSLWLEKEGRPNGLSTIELAEDNDRDEFLVDEEGDEGLSNSRYYRRNPDSEDEFLAEMCDGSPTEAR